MTDVVDDLSGYAPVSLRTVSPDPESDGTVGQPAADQVPTELTAEVEPIAIVGMGLRTAGADSVQALWRSLRDGVDASTRFSMEAQRELGAEPDMYEHPDFIPVAYVVDDVDAIDAPLFSMSPREAALADPQQRMMLEVAFTALQDAGIDPARFGGEIGVYAGAGSPGYLTTNLMANQKVWSGAGRLGIAVSNNADYTATSLSYRLNLTGPSLTVATACSTSLVAVHTACEALRNQECDAAIAGGASIELPHGGGYVAHGGFTSAVGQVRAFDADANGTVWGSGCGAVVLKRLSDAVAAGDQIHAVIRGNAINNDGATKVGFSAPSVQGQCAVIEQAYQLAGISPLTVGYQEAHGTGTAMGDPIEVEALTKAFGNLTNTPPGPGSPLQQPDRTPVAGAGVGGAPSQWCAIGSLKTNIGHCSQAAGVLSLIKAALVVKTGIVPPSLHFDEPNPAIDFERTPFFVASTLGAYPLEQGPRRAGVSSFGIGGTNAHVIVEEPPAAPASVTAIQSVPQAQSQSAPAVQWPQLLRVSARTAPALDASTRQLAEFLSDNDNREIPISDIAATLANGRRRFGHRRAAVIPPGSSNAQAAGVLADSSAAGVVPSQPRPVMFLLSGQGSQYPGMGRELAAADQAFDSDMRELAALFDSQREHSLAELIFADPSDQQAAETLRQTEYTQPALFCLEVALARYWRRRGVEPHGLLGHSIGEFAAAEIAGVMSTADAATMVGLRGRLMQGMPGGAMAAVSLRPDDLREQLPTGLEVATVNGPSACVVGGPKAQLEAWLDQLGKRAHGKLLRTSHAFHTQAMEPVVEPFAQALQQIQLLAPRIPIISTVTGALLTEQQATDPRYWAEQVRRPVRYSDAVATVVATGEVRFLEIGPGRQLAGLARMQTRSGPVPLPSLPSPGDGSSDVAEITTAAAALWCDGWDVTVPGDVAGYRTVALPTYPYERTVHWVHPDPAPAPSKDMATADMPVEVPSDSMSGTLHNPSGAADSVPGVPATQQPTATAGSPSVAAPTSVSGASTPASPVVSEPERQHVPAPTPEPATAPQQAGIEGPFPSPSDWFAVAGWQQLPPQTELATPERVVLIGQGARVRELLEQLRSAGSSVTAVDVPSVAEHPYPDELVELITDRAARSADVHVVHAATLDDVPAGDDPAAVMAAQRRGFFDVLTLLQLITAAGEPPTFRLDLLAPAALPAPGTQAGHIEHATLAAFAKIVDLEIGSIHTRYIDVDPDSSAASIAAELAAPDAVSAASGRHARPTAPAEVAIRGGRRWTKRFSQVAASRGQDTRLRRGGRYLITGGTGGIGLSLALDLGCRLGASVALLARSPLPPRSTWATETDTKLRRLIAVVEAVEAAGGTVTVRQADVTDPDSVAAALRDVHRGWGGIDGIVHAAGVPGGGMIEVKDFEAAEDVLKPKLAGTVALKNAVRRTFAADSPTRAPFVVLCSSITAVSGDVGQIDYCAGNLFLDAQAQADDWPGPVVSVNWGGWSGVGMAVETATGGPGRRTTRVDHPVLRTASVKPHGAGSIGVVSGQVSVDTCWMLAEHQVGSDPVIPGTGLLELLRAGFAETVAGPPGAVVQLADVAFVEPFRVPQDRTATVQVELDNTGAAADLRVYSEIDGERTLHAQGRASWLTAEHPEPMDIDTLIGSSEELPSTDDGIGRPGGRTSVVTFGPRWASLQRRWQHGDTEVAELRAPAACEKDNWVLHPALLDVATAFGQRGTGSYLPLGYGEVTVWGPIGPDGFSVLTYHGEPDEVVTTDVTVVGPDGTVAVSIKDFTLRRIDPAAVGAEVVAVPDPETGPGSGADASPDGGPAVAGSGARAKGKAADRLFSEALSMLDVDRSPGRIAPQQGMQVFEWLLSREWGPQVVINPWSVREMMIRVHGSVPDDGIPGTPPTVPADPAVGTPAVQAPPAADSHNPVGAAQQAEAVAPVAATAAVGPQSPANGGEQPPEAGVAATTTTAAAPNADPSAPSETVAGSESAAAPATATDSETATDSDDLVASVATIWAEVLGIDEVAANDNFFDLGGNSLVAVQLIGQIRKRLGVRLPMRALFDTPSVADMAELVRAGQAGAQPTPDAQPTPGAQPGNHGDAGSAANSAETVAPQPNTAIPRLDRANLAATESSRR
ncbi:type I polyketide synthase [Nakamurella aerolata]|uniref:SDR family NAD(P)-dependent oxidoreductase n=1 Tax=Nakamurella aerolata TaxID=1656892 RepID=A0A849AFU5_9ACTN|nr:type I polyketide synthase [Nakamurella aerolata]NNG37340.1 SDR family NAD(P)-dependent oxidoreductase [Nakamurella aerolata]